MIDEEQRNEMVIFLSRKLHWNKQEIGSLTLAQFFAVYNELAYQESLDRWEAQTNLATLLAAIYNTIPRSRGAKAFTSEDFYKARKPGRISQHPETNDSLIGEIGIRLPKGE